MPDPDPIVIVGAGMSGLLAALLVRKRCPRSEIVVVESAGHAGGQYRGLDLNGFGYCDRAMRVVYETGIAELDALLRDILPEDQWHVLPDNRKDIVGLYWQGKLQTGCQYIDLRRLPESVQRQCEQEILKCAGNGTHPPSSEDAITHLTARLGPTAGALLSRALEKLYSVPAGTLHRSATLHPAMNRVVLYNEDRMEPVLQDEAMRAVIAWPEQSTFPLKRQPPQSGLYPRRFGMNRVIDAAVGQLSRKGVRFLFNCRVASLNARQNRVSTIRLTGGTVIEHPALLINANGLNASLNLLRPPGHPTPAMLPPPRSWMVFVRSAARPNMDGLYHFFCYDERFKTFRVTNYANYCPDARNDAGYPLCVELWHDDDNAPAAIARARDELARMNVLDPSDIVAEAAVLAPNVQALCTLEGVRQLRAVRGEIQARAPHNMVTIGPFIEDGVMLLFEVWRTMYPLIVEHLPAGNGVPKRPVPAIAPPVPVGG